MNYSKSIFAIFIFLIYTSIFTGCTKETSDLNLDSNLFGQWIYTDSNNDVYAWTFYDDGTCIQTTPIDNYNWLWTIEDTKLKLHIEGGNPTYLVYKIEGDKLYFYSDKIEDWGVPFTKK